MRKMFQKGISYYVWAIVALLIANCNGNSVRYQLNLPIFGSSGECRLADLKSLIGSHGSLLCNRHGRTNYIRHLDVCIQYASNKQTERHQCMNGYWLSDQENIFNEKDQVHHREKRDWDWIPAGSIGIIAALDVVYCYDSVCLDLTCPEPIIPKFGRLATCTDGFSQGSICTLECFNGFQMAGNANITCTKTNHWTLSLSCSKKCSPGFFSESAFEPCSACPHGTFQASIDKTKCIECPPGQSTLSTNSTSADNCTDYDLLVKQVDIPSDLLTFTSKGLITVVFWAKLQSSRHPNVQIQFRSSSSNIQEPLTLSDGVSINIGSSYKVSALLSYQRWTSVIFSTDVNTKEFKLYINGVYSLIKANANTNISKSDISVEVKILSTNSDGIILSGLSMIDRDITENERASFSQPCPLISGDDFTYIKHETDLFLNDVFPVSTTVENQTCMTTNTDICKNNLCQNGVCIAASQSFYNCSCAWGYVGQFCNISAARCHQLPEEYGSVLSCSGEERIGSKTCTLTCLPGYILPKGQSKNQQYVCGISTNFTWFPTSNLPMCIEGSKPHRLSIRVSLSYTNAIPDTLYDKIHNQIKENLLKIDCVKSNICVSTSSLKSSVFGKNYTTVSSVFTILLKDQSKFGLAEFINNGTESSSMTEFLSSISTLEQTTTHVHDNSSDIFDVEVNGEKHNINPDSFDAKANVECNEGFSGVDGVCVICRRGTMYYDGVCFECDVGTYQNAEGQTSCKLCPNGYTTDDYGSFHVLHCIKKHRDDGNGDDDKDDDALGTLESSVNIAGLVFGIVFGIIDTVVVIMYCRNELFRKTKTPEQENSGVERTTNQRDSSKSLSYYLARCVSLAVCSRPFETPKYTRIAYSAILFLCTIAAAVTLALGAKGHLDKMIPGFCKDFVLSDNHTEMESQCDEVVGHLAVYRVCFAMTGFYALFCILMIKASNARLKIQNGFWLFKIQLLIGICVGAFYIPRGDFDKAWMVIGHIGAFLFMIIQLIMLIDFANVWCKSWMDKGWYTGLLFFTLMFYLVSIVVFILFFILYARDRECGLHKAFASINLIGCVILCFANLSTNHRCKPPIQASLITLYIVYLTWSAMTNNPNSKCNPSMSPPNPNITGQYAGDNASTWNDRHIFASQCTISLCIFAIVIIYSSIREGIVSKVIRTFYGGNKENYIHSFFHFMMMLGSLYVMMTLTNWLSPGDDFKTTNRAAVWVKIVPSWLCLILTPIGLFVKRFNYM